MKNQPSDLKAGSQCYGSKRTVPVLKSDPDGRIVRDFPAIWQVTKDEKFVTFRHSMQAVWKVGLALCGVDEVFLFFSNGFVQK